MPWLTTKDGRHFNTDWIDDREKQISQNEKEASTRNVVAKLTPGKLTKRNSRDLIPKDSYIHGETYKATEKELSEALGDQQRVVKQRMEAVQELEQLQDKHLDPEAVKILGKREARLLVNDRDYPDTAEARQKVDKLREQQKQLERTISTDRELIDRWDRRNAEQQREEYGKPEFKEAHGNYEGFKTDESTTPGVDKALKEGKAKVVEMTPEQYIHECAHYIFDNSTVERTLRGRLEGDTKDTQNYALMMQQGVKFDTPYLDYSKENQEGLHRAIAAYMNGIEKIPVIIVGKRR